MIIKQFRGKRLIFRQSALNVDEARQLIEVEDDIYHIDIEDTEGNSNLDEQDVK